MGDLAEEDALPGPASTANEDIPPVREQLWQGVADVAERDRAVMRRNRVSRIAGCRP